MLKFEELKTNVTATEPDEEEELPDYHPRNLSVVPVDIEEILSEIEKESK